MSAQDGAISVSAPLRTSEAEIARFVLSREEWIARQIEKRSATGRRRYEDGEEIPYFGKRLTLRVVGVSGRVGTEHKGDTLELRVKQGADEKARKRAVDAWYRKELYEAAGAMLPGIERTIGRCAGEIKVRDMKTRWGTCNVKTADITLNLRLAEKPGRVPALCDHARTLPSAGGGTRGAVLAMDGYLLSGLETRAEDAEDPLNR